jgi:hypothetical protein
MPEMKAHHRTATVDQVAVDLAHMVLLLTGSAMESVVKPVMAQEMDLAHTIFGIKDLC